MWQWVEDCCHDNYDEAPSDGSALTTGDCSQRVVCGGAWNTAARGLRVAVRASSRADGRDSDLGFRVARTL